MNEQLNTFHDWNMAIAFLQRLDRRFDEMDQASIRGDVYTWFRIARTIYRNIHFRLNEKLEKELDKNIIIELEKLFEEIKSVLFFDKSRNLNLNNQIATLSMSKGEILLDKLTIIITDLCFEKGLIFGKKEQDYLDEIRSDFE